MSKQADYRLLRAFSLTRRIMAVALVLVLVFPSFAMAERDRESANTADFKFVFFCDSHVGYLPGNRNLEQAVETIASLKPKLVIAGGDLTERGLDNEFAQFHRIVKRLAMPVYAVPGNHDARWTGKPLFVKHMGRCYGSLAVEGYHLILLDTTLSGQPDGYVDRSQIEWLKADLKAISPNTPVLVFSHHPLGQGAVDNEDEVLSLLREYNTKLYVAGHSHRSAVGSENGAVHIEDSGILEGSFLFIQVSGSELRVDSVDFLNGARRALVTLDTAEYSKRGVKTQTLQEGSRLRVMVEGEVGEATYAKLGPLPTIELQSSGKYKSGEIDVSSLPPGSYLLTVRGETSGRPARASTARVDLVLGSPLKLLWITDTMQSIIGLVSSGNTVVATGSQGKVMALDAVSGARKWTASMGSAPAGTSVAAGRLVVVATTGGTVYGLDLDEGFVMWINNSYEGITGTPVVFGERVVLTAGTSVVSLNSRTGQEQWRYDAGVALAPTLSTGGGRVFVGCFDGSLLCLDENGRRLWRAPVEKSFYYSPVFSAPAVGHGLVVVGTPLNPRGTGHTLYAFDIRDGSLAWAVNVGSVLAGPTVTRTGFAVATAAGRLVHVENGKVTCQMNAPKYFGGTMTYGSGLSSSPDGRLLAGVDTRGYVYLARSDGGGELTVAWSLGANSYNAPVWSNGRLIVASMDGRVRSYSVRQ